MPGHCPAALPWWHPAPVFPTQPLPTGGPCAERAPDGRWLGAGSPPTPRARHGWQQTHRALSCLSAGFCTQEPEAEMACSPAAAQGGNGVLDGAELAQRPIQATRRRSRGQSRVWGQHPVMGWRGDPAPHTIKTVPATTAWGREGIPGLPPAICTTLGYDPAPSRVRQGRAWTRDHQGAADWGRRTPWSSTSRGCDARPSRRVSQLRSKSQEVTGP